MTQSVSLSRLVRLLVSLFDTSIDALFPYSVVKVLAIGFVEANSLEFFSAGEKLPASLLKLPGECSRRDILLSN